MTVPFVEAVRVTKRFGSQAALQELSLEVRHSEVHALLGRNGAGKSTLAWLLAGRFDDYEGVVSMAGNIVSLKSRADALRVGVQLVTQEPSVAPNMSVRDVIVLGNEPTRWRGVRRDDARSDALATEALRRAGVNLPTEGKVADLPLEMRQLLDVVRAFAARPTLLILDEPPLGSPAVSAVLRRVADEVTKSAGAVLVISHHVDAVTAFADRITVVTDGRAIRTGTVHDYSTEAIRRDLAGDGSTWLHNDGAPTPATDRPSAAARLLTLSDPAGRSVASFRDGAVSGMSVGSSDDARTAWRSVVGLAREQAPRWSIAREGRRIQIRAPWDALEQGVVYLSGDREREGVLPNLCATDNVTFLDLETYARRGILNRRAQYAAAVSRVASTGFDATRLSEPARAFSGGNQQKLVVARAAVARADVIVLDEPSRGVDVTSLQDLTRQIRSLSRAGRWIIVLSSDDEFLRQCSDVLAGFTQPHPHNSEARRD